MLVLVVLRFSLWSFGGNVRLGGSGCLMGPAGGKLSVQGQYFSLRSAWDQVGMGSRFPSGSMWGMCNAVFAYPV